MEDQLFDLVWQYIEDPDRYDDPVLGITAHFEDNIKMYYGERRDMHLPRPSTIYSMSDLVRPASPIVGATQKGYAAPSALIPDCLTIRNIIDEW